MEAQGALIQLTSLCKDYVSAAGVVRALRDVDLTIAQGEFVAIVGTSGSGKSTLMNIVGCLDRPTAGTYELAGFDVGSRSSDARAVLRNRLIGFIFQGFNLLPRTTALENVELPLVYRGVGAKERRARSLKALEAVGLAGRVHHTPNQLSGGQQQRVAIARALVTDPPMLLADEPTGNLDTRTSLEVLALLQRLNRDRGITIVLVTHEHDIASCASRVVTFRDGRIQSDVFNDVPLDAAGELAKLPPVDASTAAVATAAPADEDAARASLPVPRAVWTSTAIGSVLGVALGFAYGRLLLDVRTLLVPVAFACAVEALLGSGAAVKALGRPLGKDQRARVALGASLVFCSLLAAITATGSVPWSAPVFRRLEHVSGAGAFTVIGVALLVLVASTLARYLLLTLFAPLFAPRRGRA